MTSREHPWGPGAATGIGSLPGTDPREAATVVLGELPDFPHLPELPGRGLGADVIGRGAALLADLPVELVPTGWRIAAHAGRDLRVARDLLARDLDAFEEAADGWQGPVKVQAPGPWTLAAGVELPTGHRAISDHGAARDVAESLAEGLRTHLADLAARVPGAQLVLQLDEPSLPGVLGGRVPTPSGYGTVRSVDPARAGQTLQNVLAVAPEGARAVHCCAPDVPLKLLRDAGADAIALDASLLQIAQYDQLGELVDAGGSLWLGVVPTVGDVSVGPARERLLSLWHDLGFADDELAASVVPTPACGLAGLTPDRARRVLTIVREVGRSLLDD